MVIYFNQWFSSLAIILKDLKQRYGDRLTIISSSKNENHPYRNYSDKFIVEDNFMGGDYIEFVKRVCIENKVDIFFVKKMADLIYLSRQEFNCELIMEDSITVRKTSDKYNIYKEIECTELKSLIPNYLITEDIEKFKNFIQNNKSCIKFRVDEGGKSFKEITDNNSYYSISKERAINYFKSIAYKYNIITMEKLYSPEISIDCYSSSKGFIALCRKKLDNRVQKVYRDEQLEDICKKIKEIFNIQNIFNVQFRFNNGELKLLDINTRLSGGAYIYTALGINILDYLIRDRFNMELNIDEYTNLVENTVTRVEYPVKIS